MWKLNLIEVEMTHNLQMKRRAHLQIGTLDVAMEGQPYKSGASMRKLKATVARPHRTTPHFLLLHLFPIT